MLTLNQIQKILEKYSFTHLPLKVSALNILDRDGFGVVVELKTLDSTNPISKAITIYSRYEVDVESNELLFMKGFEDMVRNLWMHELNEHFKFNGEFVRHPHPEEKNYCGRKESRGETDS